jgi:hypothetical protein
VKDWSVHTAVPQHDIIWPNIRHVFKAGKLRTLCATLVPLSISALVVVALILTEVSLDGLYPRAAPYLFYLTTSANVLFNAVGVPWLIFRYI